MKNLLLFISLIIIITTANIVASITIVKPNGGETFYIGKTQDIRWTDSGIAKVKIEYTIDNGLNWVELVSDYNNSGSYIWNIPAPASVTAKIRVSDFADSTDNDESDNVFSIVQPSISLTVPNGAEILKAGTNYSISWVSVGVTTVKLEYSTDGINYTFIDSSAAKGSYNWVVPNISSSTVKIKVSDLHDTNINDLSDADFRIINPALLLTIPNGGERWRSGTQQDITWTSTDVSTIKIEYTTDNINWLPIVNNVNAGDNKYTWTIPNLTSSSIKVRITDNDYNDVFDISDATFSILIPGITLTAPNGGEQLRVGSSYDITWTSSDVLTVKLEYTTDNITWKPIINSVNALDNKYIWVVPNDISSTVKVRITDNDYADVFDISDANFRIFTPVITLTSPNGGENFRGGTQQDIIWTSSDIAKVKIEYTTNNGINWDTVIDSTSDAGKKYTWTVPEITNATVKVRVSKHDENTINDISDSDFRLFVPSITVTAPNTNVNLLAGANYQITWISNDVTNVNIEYSTDNGTIWLPPIVSNYAAAPGNYTWTVPNTLSANCLIRISKSDETTINDVSDTAFRIYKPSITVVSPNGGENWRVDSTAIIKWVSFDVTNFQLEYTLDDGVSWKPIAFVADSQKYNWTIPNDISNTVKVKVTNVNNPSIFDISDSNFRIYKPVIALTSPNGGEEWRVNTNHNITWTSTDIAKVTLEYSTDGGVNYLPIVSNLSAVPQSYTWNTNLTPSNQVKIKISKTGEPTLYDESDFSFTVYQPSVTLTSPNGGELWRVNSNQLITWNKSYVDSVKLEYTTDNGGNWVVIKESVDANLLAYSWKIPNVNSAICKVRISKTSEPAISDQSDATFTIFEPTLSLVSPDGGEEWRVGTTQNIIWTQSFISNIKIDYTTNNGSEWITLDANYPALAKENNYSWVIPNNISTNCKVRISKADEPTLKDSSSNVFTIYQKVLTLTRPIGGEEFEVGKVENITWVSQYITKVKIEYTKTDGVEWILLDSVDANLGTYAWTIPDDVRTNAKIRISDNRELTLNKTSNAFTIFKRTINIVTPNGGEAWRIGTQKAITWTNTYITGNVRIDYSTDAGNNWLEINPSIAANLGSYEWTVQNTPSTSCLVRIKSNDYPAVTDSSSGLFTIFNPSIIVTSPNGGEKWRVGIKHNITWQNNFVNNVKIEYSTNNGSDWLVIAPTVLGSTQSYEWTIPNTVSLNCKVRVSDVLEPAINDVSNAVFEIFNPFITVLTPNGGELWRAGTNQTIRWNSYLVFGDSVKIEFFNGSSWTVIKDNVIGSLGQYDWAIPGNILNTNCKIKISKSDENGINDESNAAFTVYYPYVNLNTPNGGELWRVGRQETIKWKAGYTNNINIEYSTNSGTDWLSIANNIVPTDTTYAWTIPDTESDNCRIRIYDNTAPIIGDTSDNNFSIFKPFITVVRPNGGERFKVGGTETVNWNSKGVTAVSILLSTDNGLTWDPIVNTLGGTGSYNWTPIPDKVSTNCKIMIRNANEPTMFDVSDAVFEIFKPKVTVVSPNGGESWRMGTIQNITWTSNDIDNVKIELSKDDGLTFPVVITQSTAASTRTFAWTVSPDTIDYENCKIRISDALSNDYTDISDQRFRMFSPKLAVTEPNGGEKYRVGSDQIIRWTAKNVPNIKIEYSTDNGVNWILITAITSGNSMAYGWKIPNTVSQSCRVKITDISETSFYDISDNIFEIFQPQITVVAPNGGEFWQAGSTKEIKWTSYNIDKLKIEFSTNNGVNWTLITGSAIADSGYYKWEISPTLSSTTCKVKITSANEENLTDVSDAVFTIFKPLLNLIAPNGNENWRTNTEQVIKWTSENIQNIKLEYNTDDGLAWLPIKASIPASEGSYKWVVPVTPSNNCRVKISNVIDETMFDISDNTFIIYHPTITLTTPNGGERWKVGTKKDIKWESASIQNVKIEYSTNNGLNWKLINANTPAANKLYQWTVEDFPSTSCLVRVSDINEASLNDSSDAVFTIYNPKITVNSPVKGDYWRSGTRHEIRWTSNDVTTIKIEYTSDNGESWVPVENSLPASSGKYNWLIPYIPNSVSDSCRIKITDIDDGSVIGYSENTFTIYEPSIKVKSPDGGEYWRIGTQQAITWKSNDVTNVKIELSVNNGVEWETIVPSISAATGTYLWTIPNRESSSCRIKISDVNEQQLSDISDDSFTIFASNIKIVNPNATISWRVGELETITWTSNNVNKVKVEITTNDSTNWTQLITGLNASEGKYSIIVPNTPSTTCRVKVSDVTTSKVYGMSELFKIYNSNITVKSPNGGENWRAGTKKIITWESTNIDNVKIEYSTNNGSSWNDIISGIPAEDKSYEWVIPSDISSSTCKIKINNSIASNVYDVSNSVFSIDIATIQISAPLGGENWRILTNHYIAWQGNNLQAVI
ncbi:MAG TPA: hypothetical protein PL041_00230 [Melioribacteraceae bacterium]|nr:hypothetical protein [Melioribacteraceae bacterium]